MTNPDPHTQDRLTELRQEMTNATGQLVTLLNRRGEIALAIAEEKQRLGISQIRNTQREAEVLRHVAEINQGPFSTKAIQAAIQLVMDQANGLQSEQTALPIEISN